MSTRSLLFRLATSFLTVLSCNFTLAQDGGQSQGLAQAVQDDLASPWIEPAARPRIKNIRIRYTNQNGRRGRLSNLIDKPVLLLFFYTRCQNAAKCSMSVSKMASLQKTLTAQGRANQLRLLAISYEPQFDTPQRLYNFCASRGMVFGENSQALQLKPKDLESLIDDIEVPVNYNAGWVNTHGVELILIARGGAIVRKYQTIMWDNRRVESDVARLLEE